MLLDALKADLAAKVALDSAAADFQAKDAARSASKSALDSATTGKANTHAAAVNGADPNVLYGPLDGGVFAVKIDGDVLYLSPVDPASVADPTPAPAPDPNAPPAG